ncbi:hypothetical protein NO1_0585 [Candidatus Termititenax aidoneus]|uniref:Uncharacterized protein n=1 Tax=Termititenax aidoneus TaxID=2218524 RepID=A0A388TBP2_TERA1|nr:hypothetical protein NO1_0585 [Candidatus Termititenax aidoneus]
MSGKSGRSGRKPDRISMSYLPSPAEYVNAAITNIYVNNCETFDNLSTEFMSKEIVKSLSIGFNLKHK